MWRILAGRTESAPWNRFPSPELSRMRKSKSKVSIHSTMTRELEGNALDNPLPRAPLIYFQSVLQVVDDALRSTVKAQKKTLKDVDENFKKAIDALSTYEKIHNPNAMPRHLSQKG
jgi:hypothetical protein